MTAAPVFAIQHFCIHDGPGVRSLVFVQGCPLRCAWCQNPEAWDARPHVAFSPGCCVGCGQCVDACTREARAEPGLPDPRVCSRCFGCVPACPAGALERIGERLTADEVARRLSPELPLMRTSGGGVTLSGGEPTAHPAFLAELVERLRGEGVGVAVETCGVFEPSALPAGLELVLFDVKIADPGRFRELCAGDAAVVDRNLEALAAAARGGEGTPLWPRLPLVPGVTDDAANLRAWGRRLAGLGLRGVTLVPYHGMGEDKRARLGHPAGVESHPPDPAEIEAARAVLAAEGVESWEPGEEPWDEVLQSR